jgi:hypothetical protein
MSPTSASRTVVCNFMKTLITFSLLLFSHSILGQISKLGGTFFSDEQDRISLNEGQGGIMFENRDMYHLYFEKEFEYNDTLKLQLIDNAAAKDKVYFFKVSTVTNNYFTLKPISKSSKRIFKNRQEITFYREGFRIDSSLSFEKLIFLEGQSNNHYSEGIYLQIDSSKTIFFHFISSFDTTLNGNYKGKLTDNGYETLIGLLKMAHLKKLFWPPSEYYGQAPTKLILYFNGQRKELNSVGDSPYITSDLILFFKNIHKYATVVKTNANFTFSR